MKNLLSAAVGVALLAGASAASALEISANVTLASDYKFRGISQTDEGPAIQGGFDLAFDNGFYVGTWGSNVDFANSLELDYYAGWAGNLTDNLSVDVGYLYYDYPESETEDDYQEVYGSISLADFTVGVHYSDDYYFESGEFYYVYADYGFSFGDGWGVALHVALNQFDDEVFLSDGADSYIDYKIGLTKEWAGVEFGVAYVGTDLDEEEYFDTDLGDPTVVFSITKSM